jgi:hypothetical protein
MVICATEGCGVPGRPFPPCDLCRQKAYCQSHCLFFIDEHFSSQLQYALIHDDEETVSRLLNGETVSYDRLSNARWICPPCKSIVQPLFDWLQRKHQNIPEEKDDQSE